MGEEETKQQAKADEEKKEDEKAEENNKDDNNKPWRRASPICVVWVDLHCLGCAKKIARFISKIRGVEEVIIDMAQNQVSIKGIVEPRTICTSIHNKTKRRAQVVSPLPTSEGDHHDQVVDSQVSGLTTVELNVNLHCEACADQLKRKILKMKGVRTAETDLSSGKVTVTGSMDANKLVDYVYRHTKKQAKLVVPPADQLPPPSQPDDVHHENPKDQQALASQDDSASAATTNKEEGDQKPPAPAEEAKETDKELLQAAAAAEKKVDVDHAPPQEEKKDGSGDDAATAKQEQGVACGGEEETVVMMSSTNIHDDGLSMQKMMYYYQPLYVIERIPPAPQLFSDENPNACCIT